MENRQQQILSEIQSMMASVRGQLNLLDAKISEFQQYVSNEEEQETIDLEPIEFISIPTEPEVLVNDLPEDDDLPFFDEPENVVEQVESVAAPVTKSTSIIDTMTEKQAWRTDMPGSAVKDVRSAISLNDRILFINKLFDEDPMAFQAAIGKINAMESLAQVIEYVDAEHSDWNLESDTVYRFMMAVRRKVR